MRTAQILRRVRAAILLEEVILQSGRQMVEALLTSMCATGLVLGVTSMDRQAANIQRVSVVFLGVGIGLESVLTTISAQHIGNTFSTSLSYGASISNLL